MGIFCSSKKTKNAGREVFEQAKNIIHFAKKVINYRKDVLPANIVDQIKEENRKLDILKSSDKNTEELSLQIRKVESLIRKHGGSIYPISFWSENIEIFLVTAILAIGLRAFFLEPFKIPTNSMYPTFSGMRPYIYSAEQKVPNFASKVLRFITLGSSMKTMSSPADGKLVIPLFTSENKLSRLGQIEFKPVKGRILFGFWTSILPKVYREYTFYVNDQPSILRVPYDFYGMEEIVSESVFSGEDFHSVIKNAQKYDDSSLEYDKKRDIIAFHTGKTFSKNQPIIRFEILTGDMLFVDKMSYHFRSPKVGEPFVFKTEKIPQIAESKYYIKRLVGKEDDILKIEESRLFRNNLPITGAEAFELNAKKIGEYRGYKARGNLSSGLSVRVPKNHFYALGDNSPESGDSRFWGFVPKSEVVGKALFILYPFTSRWGFAK